MLFLDIETKNTFNDSNVSKLTDLKISYVGVMDEDGKEYDFWEHDMKKLNEMLKKADMIVHYNGFSFDMPIIAKYVGDHVLDIPQIDLMVAAYKSIGFRPKLDDLTNATLDYGKNASGLDAVKFWIEGDLERLRNYCLQDVKITMDLYRFGVEHGYVMYYDKNGFKQRGEINWDDGKRVSTPDPNADVLTLF